MLQAAGCFSWVLLAALGALLAAVGEVLAIWEALGCSWLLSATPWEDLCVHVRAHVFACVHPHAFVLDVCTYKAVLDLFGSRLGLR